MGWDNSCYKLETNQDIEKGQLQGMEHCQKEHNAYLAVLNAREETLFLDDMLQGAIVSVEYLYLALITYSS